MTSATAPGKIILLGEHAVVYGQPALAIPVTQVGVTINIEIKPLSNETGKDWKDRILISAPDIERFGYLSEYGSGEDPIACVIESVLTEFEMSEPPHLHVQIQSNIPVASGLGSGAAVSVALIRAMANSLGRTISDDIVSEIAFEAEKLHHGTPSGIDNTVITYAKPVYYVKGKPIGTFNVKDPFWLIIADSGISTATKETVGDVRKLWLSNPEKHELIFSQIGEIVKEGRSAIEEGEMEKLGDLMNQNHALLKELTVSSDNLDGLINTALANGALGAKLSGGGRGGNILALVTEEKIKLVDMALLAHGAPSSIITKVS